MNIGMIFECQSNGPDLKVCEYLTYKITDTIKIYSIGLSNKLGLINDCGKAASDFLNQGCEKIIIVWDLAPSWKRNQPPCRKNDKEKIIASLKASNVPEERVVLVCIEMELEAWLLADSRAIKLFLESPARSQIKVPEFSHPDKIAKPKMRLDQIFRENRHAPYNGSYHAIKIIQHIQDTNRLESHSESFKRFAQKIRSL